MIHFCLIQSEGKPYIGMIAHLRRYLKNIGLPADLEYEIFTFNSNRGKDNPDSKIARVGEYTYGKTAIDICSVVEICQLLNNASQGKELLDGIAIPGVHMSTAKKLKAYYEREAHRMDTVMFSIFEPLLFLSLFTAIWIKQQNPAVKVIFGGMHIQASPNTVALLELIECVDHVIVGDLAAGTKDYLEGSIRTQVHVAEDENLDLLHPAIYYKDEVEVLAKLSTREKPGVWVNGVKGCPNSCKYCVTNSVKFKAASVAAVVDSVKAIESLGVEGIVIHLNDNTTNYSERRTWDFTNALIAAKAKTPLHAFMTLDGIDEDIAGRIKESSIESLLLGYGGEIDKVRMLGSIGIHCLLFSIFCTPEETMADFYMATSNVGQIIAERADIGMLLYTYDHFAGNRYFNEGIGVAHEMWPEQELLEKSDEINSVICNTPRYYYRDTFDLEEYTRRRAEVVQLMTHFL